MEGKRTDPVVFKGGVNLDELACFSYPAVKVYAKILSIFRRYQQAILQPKSSLTHYALADVYYLLLFNFLNWHVLSNINRIVF
jgi:hypothetical protein